MAGFPFTSSRLWAFLALPLAGCSSAAIEVEPAGTGGDGNAMVSQPVCTDALAPQAPARLLTRAQYDNTVRDLLGDSTAPARVFPPESTMLGFENNAEVHQASPLLVENLMQAAEGVAARALAQGGALLAQCEGALDAECARNFVRDFGARAFRRPLSETERTLFEQLLETTAAAEGYDRGVELTLQAFLQSPQFLYRLDTRVETGNSEIRPLGPYEIASRLSYFLINSMPDAELFAAAAAGELASVDQLRSQGQRLLADPRAGAMVGDFHRQWLGLDRLGPIVREVATGVEQPGLGPSLQGSLQHFAQEVYFGASSNLAALFGSPAFYVDAQLAPLFGATGPTDASFARIDDTTGTRFGLLTQPALLSLFAHENQSAPILRGAFIREQVMCQPVPPPPPTVDNTPPDPATTGTTRQRFVSHSSEATCASCHSLFDDLGFALEHYDHLGRYRLDENGMAIDAAGEVRAAQDANLNGPFSGPAELFTKLAASPQIANCLSTQWYRYAMGRVEAEADACSLQAVQAATVESGGDLHTLLLALVASDAFRYRAALPEELPTEASP